MFEDKETTFDDGSEEGYSPTNYNSYLGNITVRQAVESSQNIPFVSIMEMLSTKKSIKYLKKLGITSLTEEDDNLSLALGGLQNGFSPLEMAAAYATLANNGVYIEPTFYTLIENSNGKKVLKTKQESHKVFSEETAYIITKLLDQPVHGTYGTATYCALDGIDVAAKTGTTNNNYDRWLCEYTPYYTAVTWYGFDLNERINYNGLNPAGLLSARVMASIHSTLPSKYFEKPDKVVEATICSETGMLANSGCSNTYTEYFLPKTLPGNCTKHSGSSVSSPTTTNNNSTYNINLDDETLFIDKEVPEDTYNKNNSSNNNVNVTEEIKPTFDSSTNNTSSTIPKEENNNTYTNTESTPPEEPTAPDSSPSSSTNETNNSSDNSSENSDSSDSNNSDSTNSESLNTLTSSDEEKT